MATQDLPTEIVEALLHRFPFVESLRDGPKDKRGLIDALEYSRSTVDRSTRELETLGVVEYVDGAYRLTPFGESVRAGFVDLVESIEHWQRFDPLLRWVPAGAVEPGPELLSEATLYLPEPGDPWAMVNRHVKLLAQSDDVRCVIPLTGLHAYEVIHERVVENGARAEIITTPGVVRTFLTDPSYKELTAALTETGRFELRQYDDAIPYYVGLLDETVQIGVDEAGEPRALAEATTVELLQWATDVYAEYREQVTPVVTPAEIAEL